MFPESTHYVFAFIQKAHAGHFMGLFRDRDQHAVGKRLYLYLNEVISVPKNILGLLNVLNGNALVIALDSFFFFLIFFNSISFLQGQPRLNFSYCSTVCKKV